MIDGQIVVRVALEKGPRDEVSEPDWTDLTSRVRRYRHKRGRTDVLRPFGPGSATVELFNGDRMLDPSNPDGLLFNGSDEPIGLPLCPVQIGAMWHGTEYRLFTGFLGPEAWQGGTAPKGESGTVTMSVMDALGHSPGLPPDMWGMGVAQLQPDWWSRMDDIGFPVLDDGSEVPNSIGDGHGTIEGTTGISRPFSSGSAPSGGGVMDPGLLLSGDHALRFPASGVMPDGDQDKLTMFLWWSARDDVPAGEQAWVAKFVHPITGIHRLSVYVDGDDGLAYVTTFDAAETIVDSDTIDPSLAGFSRFDGGEEHMLCVRWDAGGANNVTVWFGGISVTLAIPGDLYESDLLCGPAPVDCGLDEVTIWQRALLVPAEIEPVFMQGGFGMMWSGDQWLDRLTKLIEATGRTTTSDDTEQMHFTESEVDGLWGLVHPSRPSFDGSSGNYSVSLPGTLARGFQDTVEWAGGARWATKDGYLRARSLAALTDASWVDDYAQPLCFTDGDTSTAARYRHAGVEVTGLRIDRVINVARRSFLSVPGGPPVVNDASPMTVVARDQASIDRYEERSDDSDSEWCDWVLNQELVELLVDRFAQPHQEIENIHLDPVGTGDDADDLAWWLITQCELELWCEVEYTPAGSDPIVVTDLNIQHIAWEWTPERWSVDLVAAKS